MDLRHQNLKFCFRSILEGTFNFEALREVISLWRHLGMDEGRYDMGALIQFSSNPKGEQRLPKAALKRALENYPKKSTVLRLDIQFQTLPS